MTAEEGMETAAVGRAVVAAHRIEDKRHNLDYLEELHMKSEVAERSSENQPNSIYLAWKLEKGAHFTYVDPGAVTQAWTLATLRHSAGRVSPAVQPSSIFLYLLCLVFR